MQFMFENPWNKPELVATLELPRELLKLPKHRMHLPEIQI